MRKENKNTSLPVPLWLLVDDQPETEIFNRLASFIDFLHLEDGKEFYERVIAQSGVIHEHPALAVAWSTGDLQELAKLLDGRRKALVQMDLFFEGREQSSRHGLRLTEQLLAEPSVRENAVFLLKTRTEAAFADAFRRENISYLRTIRGLDGVEAAERIQFLGANTDSGSQDPERYQNERVGNLLLGLQEEAFLEAIKERRWDSGQCRRAIEEMAERGFFGVLGGNREMEKKYVDQFLKVAFDDSTVPNLEGGPLALGHIEHLWKSQNRTRSPKKLFVTAARDANALELALLRHGTVAAVEATLFTLAGWDRYEQIGEIKSGILNQKWKPNNFERLSVIELKDVQDAITELDEIVSASSGEAELPEVYQALRDLLSPARLIRSNLLEAATTFIELRAFVRNHCSPVGCSLAAPALLRLERTFQVERGLKVLPAEASTYFNQDGEDRVQRFGFSKKVYALFNRRQILHNIVAADEAIRESAAEDDEEAIVEALRLDPQCGRALANLAALSVSRPEAFESLAKRLENERSPIGLPHPAGIGSLFRDDSETGEFRGFDFFLRHPEAGGEASLMDLVVAGLQVLRYHIENYLRLLSWSTESAIGHSEEVFETLASVWRSRRWERLFALEVPDLAEAGDQWDPLRGAWGREANLLAGLCRTSGVAKHVSESWRHYLDKWNVALQEDGIHVNYKGGSVPPDWLRLLWLGLPLDYAEELERTAEAKSMDDDESGRALNVVSLINDRARGDPYRFQETLNGLLQKAGSDFRVKEPLNEFDWAEDEAFLKQVDTAMELLEHEARKKR